VGLANKTHWVFWVCAWVSQPKLSQISCDAEQVI